MDKYGFNAGIRRVVRDAALSDKPDPVGSSGLFKKTLNDAALQTLSRLGRNARELLTNANRRIVSEQTVKLALRQMFTLHTNNPNTHSHANRLLKEFIEECEEVERKHQIEKVEKAKHAKLKNNRLFAIRPFPLGKVRRVLKKEGDIKISKNALILISSFLHVQTTKFVEAALWARTDIEKRDSVRLKAAFLQRARTEDSAKKALVPKNKPATSAFLQEARATEVLFDILAPNTFVPAEQVKATLKRREAAKKRVVKGTSKRKSKSKSLDARQREEEDALLALGGDERSVQPATNYFSSWF